MAAAEAHTGVFDVFFGGDSLAVVRDAQHFGGIRFYGAQDALHDGVGRHLVEIFFMCGS